MYVTKNLLVAKLVNAPGVQRRKDAWRTSRGLHTHRQQQSNTLMALAHDAKWINQPFFLLALDVTVDTTKLLHSNLDCAIFLLQFERRFRTLEKPVQGPGERGRQVLL